MLGPNLLRWTISDSGLLCCTAVCDSVAPSSLQDHKAVQRDTQPGLGVHGRAATDAMVAAGGGVCGGYAGVGGISCHQGIR